MIRATTGGVLKSYRRNLMNSFISQNKARDTVLTQRNFNSYAEDPAAAAKAFRLRKSRMTVNSQHAICKDTLGKFETAWDCLESVSLMIDNDTGKYLSTISGTTKSMLNDPEGDAREQLSKALDQISQTIVQTMNQKYGDNFIFAGADGHNVPFEVKDDKLYYRGVSVDAAEPNVLKTPNEALVQVDQDGNYSSAATPGYYLKMDNVKLISVAEYNELYSVPELEVDTTGGNNVTLRYDADQQLIPDDPADGETQQTYYFKLKGKDEFISVEDYTAAVSRANSAPARLMNQAGGQAVTADQDGNLTPGGDYYLTFDGDPQVISAQDYDDACLEAEKLDYLRNEKLLVDIGLGFQENENRQLIESSAFDAALHGINFIGSGVDKDGDPRNIYSLVQRLKEISDNVPENGLWDDPTYEEFRGLVLKLETASSDFKTAFTNFDAGTTKLSNNEKLLSENFDTLQEQYSELEDVNAADAITSFVWAMYCYNAALKVGNNVMSESLMDFLN